MADVISKKDLTALVSIHGNLTPKQEAQLRMTVTTSPHNKKYVMNFLQKEEFDCLTLTEKLDALWVCDQYNVSGSTFAKFIQSGYSVSQAADVIEFSRSYNPPAIVYKKTTSGKAPDLSEYLGYENLRFIDSIGGNNHDPKVIERTLADITEIMEESQTRLGLGEVVHLIKDVYARHNNAVNIETATRIAINVIHPSSLVSNQNPETYSMRVFDGYD